MDQDIHAEIELNVCEEMVVGKWKIIYIQAWNPYKKQQKNYQEEK